MSIPGVSFNQTQETQSWVEFGKDLGIYTAAFCLPIAALYTYKAVKAVTKAAISEVSYQYNSWNAWYKFRDERESIRRAINCLTHLNGDALDAASRVISLRTRALSKGDFSGAWDLDREHDRLLLLQKDQVRITPFMWAERERISLEIDGMGGLSTAEFTAANDRIKTATEALGDMGDMKGVMELNEKRMIKLQEYLNRPEVKHLSLIQDFQADLGRIIELFRVDLSAASALAGVVEARYNQYSAEQKAVLAADYGRLQTAKSAILQRVGEIIWARTDAEIWADIAAQQQAELN